MGESSRCPCGEPSQTAEHIPQHHGRPAQQIFFFFLMWPSNLGFADKIYEPTEALRITSIFMIRYLWDIGTWVGSG